MKIKKMNKKLITAAITGFLFTIGASFIPKLVDPLIKHHFLTWDRLHTDDEIVIYLRSIQHDEDIILGLHGYRHLCPLDDSWGYEFWDPEGKLTENQLKMLIDSSTQIFSDVGITEYLFVPPGNKMDERAWALFEEKGFGVYLEGTEYTMAFSPNFSTTKLERSRGIINKALQQTRVYGEYTWFWRNMTGFDDPRYEEAIQQEKEEEPMLILLHQQDLNQYTLNFLGELPYQPEIIRGDDFTLEADKVKKLVEIARSHNSVVIISVIPSFPPPSGSSLFQIWNKAFSVLFLGAFVFPTAVFLSWYAMVRRGQDVR